jgi:AcrR family transcriptional regulator
MLTDDRRIRKTKKALREALAELMMNKELRCITIRELSNAADVHRATFYAHYKDIYDLYEQLEDALIDEIGTIIVGDPSHSYKEHFRLIIDYLIDNSKTCRMFLRSQTFNERLSNFLEEKYLDIWKYETGQKEVTEEWRYLTRYHIHGFLAIIRLWTESDYSYPKDKLTNMIFKIDEHFDEFAL